MACQPLYDPTCLLCLGADISYAKLARAPVYSTVAIFPPIPLFDKKGSPQGPPEALITSGSKMPTLET